MYIFNLQDQSFLPHRSCDVYFSLDRGEALVLLGENGIGKSTLLRRLNLDHNDVSFLEQKSLEFFYDRRLYQIYHFVMGLKGVNKLRFERAWKDFHLNLKEDRTLKQLSGGEAQALKISLALAKEAEIYFMDEPSQYLDSLKKQILLQQMQKLLSEGKSILIVEHDIDWLPHQWRKLTLIDENSCLRIES